MGYWNGSVLGWTKTDSGLKYQKLFLFEGVNLRKIIRIIKTHLKESHSLRRVEAQLDGTYLSLSRNVGWSEEYFFPRPFSSQGGFCLQGPEDWGYPTGLDKRLHRSPNRSF